MATPAQIRANRANAQFSTGPRSAEGKAAVRFNAWKHGIDAESLILPGEDPAGFEELRRSYYDQFRPGGPVETALLDTVIRADWNQRRYARLEAEVLKTLVASLEKPGEHPLGAAFHQDAAGANALQKLFRRQQAAQRDWRKALAELRQLQAERPPVPDAAPAEPGPPAAPAPVALPNVLAVQPKPVSAAVPHNVPAVPAKGANWLGSEPPEWRL
jgi:hypothetical protein